MADTTEDVLSSTGNTEHKIRQETYFHQQETQNTKHDRRRTSTNRKHRTQNTTGDVLPLTGKAKLVSLQVKRLNVGADCREKQESGSKTT